ncbi:MAG TPA: hypothetical protein VFT79_06810 [Solirubrobacterales bacterium]|nr:hypothetical protein [Solirubrobacterales bacterium]
MTIFVLALVAGTLAHSPASAAESASIQAILTPEGGGRMIANSQTNPDDESWSWEACTVDLRTCTPFTEGRIVETAGAPVPSVFRVTSSRGATTLSPQWNGKVTSTSLPSIAGTVRANELVVPVPGEWSGGWEGDVDWTQLAACKGPNDNDCTTLTHRHYVGGCANGAAVIDPMFTGMYLRVADRRIPAHTPELAYAVGSPYTPDIWPAGATVSVAFAGRIKAATGPPASDCGPSPLVEASISSRGVATVRCGLGCRATLVARQGKRKAAVVRKLAPLPYVPREASAQPKLRLRPGQKKRFNPGPIRMIVKVYGRSVASRTVTFDS